MHGLYHRSVLHRHSEPILPPPHSASHTSGDGRRGQKRRQMVNSRGSPLQIKSRHAENQNEHFSAASTGHVNVLPNSPRAGSHRVKPLPSGSQLVIADSADNLLTTSNIEHDKSMASGSNSLSRSLRRSGVVLKNAWQSDWPLKDFGKTFSASDKKSGDKKSKSSKYAEKVDNVATTSNKTSCCPTGTFNIDKPLPDVPLRKRVVAKLSDMFKKSSNQANRLEKRPQAKSFVARNTRTGIVSPIATVQYTDLQHTRSSKFKSPLSFSLHHTVAPLTQEVDIATIPIRNSRRPAPESKDTLPVKKHKKRKRAPSETNTITPGRKFKSASTILPSPPPTVTTFASSSPTPASPVSTNQNEDKSIANYTATNNNNYSEINRLTNSGMSLLTLARAAPRGSSDRKKFIELSKAIIRIVNTAREMEQDREVAHQAAIRAETRCIEIRQLMEGMTRLLEGLLVGETQGHADDKDCDGGSKVTQKDSSNVEERAASEAALLPEKSVVEPDSARLGQPVDHGDVEHVVGNDHVGTSEVTEHEKRGEIPEHVRNAIGAVTADKNENH